MMYSSQTAGHLFAEAARGGSQSRAAGWVMRPCSNLVRTVAAKLEQDVPAARPAE